MMTRVVGRCGIFVLLVCATPLIAQRSTRRVIDRAGIAAAGWHRVGEIADALPPGSTASVEGFNHELRGSRLGFYETTGVQATWLVRLDGQTMPMQIGGLWILDVIPVVMTQIDSIVIDEGARLTDGRSVFLGTIDLYTRKARRGASLLGSYQHGDESGDPGPYRYTARAAPNVEKVGPFAEGAAAIATDLGALDVGARYLALNTTDEYLIARVDPLFPQLQWDVNASGGSGVATIDALGGRTYIVGGRGRFTGLLPLPMDTTNQQGRVVTSQGGLSGSLRALDRDWRYEATGTLLEIRQLSGLLVMPEQKRLMLDGFLETRIATDTRAGIGATAGRHDQPLDIRRRESRRAWVTYARDGVSLDVAAERSAGRTRVSGSAGFEWVLPDSDRVGLVLQTLEAWRFGDFLWMDRAAADSGSMRVTDLRAEITTAPLLRLRPTWYARTFVFDAVSASDRSGGFVFDAPGAGDRVTGVAAGLVASTTPATRVTARVRAELTQLLGDARVGERSTPGGFVEATTMARTAGGFDLALSGRFAPSTRWTGPTLSAPEDVPATRRIDFSANKSLWKDRVRAQLVMRNLLLTPEWNRAQAAHWSLRTHLGVTVALPSGASGR